MRFVFFLAALFVPVTAFAYETGGMSCDDVGRMASIFVMQRDSGMDAPDALARYTKVFVKNRQQGILAAQVAGQIWGTPALSQLTPEGAAGAYTADCEAQK